MNPGDFLRGVAVGTRVVARYLLEGGSATDALGTVLSRDHSTVVIDTKRGPAAVPIAAVIAAKEVPPPPAARPRTIGA